MSPLPSPSDQPTTTAYLTHLATAFRDPSIRNTYVQETPNFAGWLDQVINRVRGGLNDHDDGFLTLGGADGRKEVVEIMRVVANFVADNDDNRKIIHEHTSAINLLNSLLMQLTSNTSPTEHNIDLDLAKPLLGAILNLVLTSTYTPAHDYWIKDAKWIRIVVLGNRLYLPGEETKGGEWEESCDVRAVLASWAWKIVASISETETFTQSNTLSGLPPTTLIHLTTPLQNFTRKHPTSQPPNTHTNTKPQDLDILANSTTLIHLLSTTPDGCLMIGETIHAAGARVQGRNIQDGSTTAEDIGIAAERMVLFVEDGDVLDCWEDDEDDEDEEEEGGGDDQSPPAPAGAPTADTQPAAKPTPPPTSFKPGEKQLGLAKSSIMAALAEVCGADDFDFLDRDRDHEEARDDSATMTDADTGSGKGVGKGSGVWLWETLQRWMGVGRDGNGMDAVDKAAGARTRDDLVSCALLCIANYIKSDTTASNIASQRIVITRLIHLLNTATSETPAQITHSLIGLLRNLALAPHPELKQQLVGPVIAACVRIGVFTREKDILGSVQGGAVVLVRLLCRNNYTTSCIVAANFEMIEQILAMQERADDQAIKIEVSRLITTLLTSLAKQGPINSSGDQQSRESYIEVLVRDSRSLACPASLIALGSQHEILLAEGVLALALVAKSNSKAIMGVLRESSSTLSALQEYAVSVTAPQPVISNICILFLHLASGMEESTTETDITRPSARVSAHAGEEEEIDVERRIVECLSGISQREDLDKNIRMVVEAAQRAWKVVKV